MTKNAEISRTKRKKLQACQKVANEMGVPLALSLLKNVWSPETFRFLCFRLPSSSFTLQQQKKQQDLRM